MAAWQEQFERVLRSLKKVEQSARQQTEHLDNLFHFFQDCWHLKDWIKNDDTLPQSTRDALVRDAENSESLKFCADLANGTKHLKLTKRVRKGAVLWYVESIATVDAKTGETISKVPVGYLIASLQGSPTPSDAIGFARKTVQDWTDLLTKHGLKS